MQYAQYHFLLIPPSLGAEWLFDAARAYWARYRPTVVSDLVLISFLPPEVGINVTVIARKDRIAEYGVQLAQTAPNARFDAVSFDTFEQTRAELNRRVEVNLPFGMPMLPPTATANPDAFVPTPWLPGTPPAATPTPEPPPQFPTPVGGEPDPIEPTPGSIIGG